MLTPNILQAERTSCSGARVCRSASFFTCACAALRLASRQEAPSNALIINSPWTRFHQDFRPLVLVHAELQKHADPQPPASGATDLAPALTAGAGEVLVCEKGLWPQIRSLPASPGSPTNSGVRRLRLHSSAESELRTMNVKRKLNKPVLFTPRISCLTSPMLPRNMPVPPITTR